MVSAALAAAAVWCSPAALAASPDGRTLYVGCATGRRVEVWDTAAKKRVSTLPMPGEVTGLAMAGSRLLATAGNELHMIDGAKRVAVKAGHTPESPAVSPDGALAYVPNRFTNDVSVVDLRAGRELRRIRAVREPAGVAVSRDGATQFVINSVPAGRADAAHVAAEIGVVQEGADSRIVLPNGSAELRAIAVSPDGTLAAVTHLVARYYLPTAQLERGWMETNALTLLDVPGRRRIATVLLDDIDLGAANPWALAWSADGVTLAVTHAGTHEVSLIDVPAMLKKARAAKRDPVDDLTFMQGVRRRVKLNGNGPRALAAANGRWYVGGYFSDTIEEVEPDGTVAPFARLSDAPMTVVRRGEMLFNDATQCFQGWQSCVSCHSPDARVDGLNWDLLNDGIGNPKNVKSLLFSHRTPPAMSHGVRERAEVAVRSGIRYILFAQLPDSDAAAIDEWLKSLKPVPSPHPPNERGKAIFFDPKTGCATCHPAGLFTDLKGYDVGTRNATDSSGHFDTPTLIEIWRTAPYLHDGSAATLHDALGPMNRGGRHGRTSHLTPQQLDDLVAYLLSL